MVTQLTAGSPPLLSAHIPDLKLLAEAQEPTEQVFILCPDEGQKRLLLSFYILKLFGFGLCQVCTAISSLEQVYE